MGLARVQQLFAEIDALNEAAVNTSRAHNQMGESLYQALIDVGARRVERDAARGEVQSWESIAGITQSEWRTRAEAAEAQVTLLRAALNSVVDSTYIGTVEEILLRNALAATEPSDE
jgi:hypothetical protein